MGHGSTRGPASRDAAGVTPEDRCPLAMVRRLDVSLSLLRVRRRPEWRVPRGELNGMAMKCLSTRLGSTPD